MNTIEDFILVRNSKAEDIQPIQDLLKKEKLPVDGVEKHFNNFLSLFSEERLIGTVGLEIYGNKALLRSLVVEKSYQGKGYGKKLCNEIIENAYRKEISELYLLTETVPQFFEKIGFKIIPRDSADEKVKTSEEFSKLCPSTAVCMMLKLRAVK
jgi:amino-acid N-acetyltransferase